MKIFLSSLLKTTFWSLRWWEWFLHMTVIHFTNLCLFALLDYFSNHSWNMTFLMIISYILTLFFSLVIGKLQFRNKLFYTIYDDSLLCLCHIIQLNYLFPDWELLPMGEMERSSIQMRKPGLRDRKWFAWGYTLVSDGRWLCKLSLLEGLDVWFLLLW